MLLIIFCYYVNKFGTHMPFEKGICMVFCSANEPNTVKLPHSAQRKLFFGKNKIKVKITKEKSQKENHLVLLNHILEHRSTKSLMDGDTVKFWEYIAIRVYPDPFCTSCQISTINKKPRSKTPLKLKTPF